MLFALSFFTGCSNTTSGKTPSNYEQLRGLIGKPVEEICQTLELDKDAVTAAIGERLPYTVSTGLDYAGVSWDVQLLGDAVGVYGFQYFKDYGEDAEQAAKDAKALAQHLSEHYGGSDDNGGITFDSIDVKEIVENSSANKTHYSIVEAWDRNDELAPDMQKAYDDRIALMENPHTDGVQYKMILTYLMNSGSVHLKIAYAVVK
jgi:hypothetical protein